MIYLFSFLVSACVSVLNNIQRKYFVLCGLAGAFTYMAYLFFTKYTNESVASLLACIILAVISQLFAKLTKAPSTIFTIPGIMPIVSGSLLFKAFNFLVEDQYSQALSLGLQAMLVGFSIAIGLILNESITYILKKKNYFSFNK